MSDVSDTPIVRITVTRNVTLVLRRRNSNVTPALISDDATSPLCLGLDSVRGESVIPSRATSDPPSARPQEML
jgi:hypothetical protein